MNEMDNNKSNAFTLLIPPANGNGNVVLYIKETKIRGEKGQNEIINKNK